MYDAACMLRQSMTQHLDAQRCAHKLAAHFGFSPPHPPQNGAASTGPHPSQGELKLKLIRQVSFRLSWCILISHVVMQHVSLFKLCLPPMS